MFASQVKDLRFDPTRRQNPLGCVRKGIWCFKKNKTNMWSYPLWRPLLNKGATKSSFIFNQQSMRRFRAWVQPSEIVSRHIDARNNLLVKPL